MARLLCKPGVTPPSILLVCGVANAIADLAIPSITLTAARNGNHRKGSRHYVDAALDLRTKTLSATAKADLLSRLRLKFPAPVYDVLFESAGTPNEHIHIEDNRVPTDPPRPLATRPRGNQRKKFRTMKRAGVG